MMSLVSFGEEICLLVSIKAACHTRYETVYITCLRRLVVVLGSSGCWGCYLSR